MKLEKTWFAIRALADKANAAEIFLYDQIGGWGITVNEFIDQLKAVASAEELHVRIFSPGGSVVVGNAIYAALKRHKGNVIVHIDGMAASIASVIAMAGKEIRMGDNALLMIHNPWTYSEGTAEELRRDADLLDTMKETILTAYDRSGLDRAEISRLMDAETYMTAKQALELGFIDMIETGLEAAASTRETSEMVEASELKVPYKMLLKAEQEARAAEASRLTETVNTLKADLQDRDGAIEGLQDTIKGLKTDKGELKAQIETLKTTHKEELEQTAKVRDEAIARKAAELLQSQGIDPVNNDEEGAGSRATTEEAFWAEYNSLPIPDRNDWYKSNKHRLKG